MASAFRSANHADDMSESASDPPKPLDAASAATNPQNPSSVMDDATTPTRATFRNSGDAAAAIIAASGSAALASQKPLPTSPFPQAVQVPEPSEKTLPKRENSQHSRKSGDSEDVDMNDSDAEDGAGDDAGSDDDSVNADGTKSKNKKKSQRFYCTDYPPCNLSFTRSEHLARHIRKHTGERPFQCHCSRRFSRLDNLRQHAQTVHVNEDIPVDSLAAVSTRFVRQARQERVRGNGRARASTAGSVGTPPRGHSKSLSTSSITSIGSLGSYSPRDDPIGRRRPPPLVMADPRSRLSLESYRSAADSQFSYRAPSPSEFSTPTSGTFSTGQSSPRWSGMASPASVHSRAHSMYASGSRTPGRRLSVPSAAGNPFHSPQNRALGRPLFGAGAMNASNAGVFSPGTGSMISSPTVSSVGWSRRESMSSAADEAWRRRTWHPDSREYSAGGSRLSNVITPGQLQSAPLPSPAPVPGPGAIAPAPPLALAPAPGQQSNVRLPGIESFDPLPHMPVGASPRRIPSPMMVDSEMANAPAHMSDSLVVEDRRLSQWDMGLHRGLTKLDLAANTPPRDSAGAWANEANSAVQAQAEQVRAQPTVRFEPEPRVVSIPHSAGVPPPSSYRGGYHQHTMSAPSITTSRESKRHGWYHGPATAGLSQVPELPTRGPRVDRMIHPNLANGFTGFPARESQPITTSSSPRDHDVEMESERPPQSESMRRLEALVAVATSEGSTAAAY